MSEVSTSAIQTVINLLGKYELVQFGSFKLVSGIQAPFYIDLRKVQSYPNLLHAVSNVYAEMLSDTDESILLAGVPEAGTPLATAVGYQTHRRLIQPRKVVKTHGTKRSIEGVFNGGDKVVLIDDLITKGDSKLKAIQQVEDAGLVVDSFLLLIDLEQDGMDAITQAGYTIRAAIKVSRLVRELHASGMLDEAKCNEVLGFIKSN